MAPRFFTRCYSSSSIGALTSGKGAVGEKLGGDMLLREFQNHSFHSQHRNLRKKLLRTALVSVSDRIIDTLSRALVKWQGLEEIEPEPADQIWVVFIAVPGPDSGIYHHGKDLAGKIGKLDLCKYKHEYIFEWEVPQKYIIHTVSLQTLMDRGLGVENYIEHGRPPSTQTLKERMSIDYLFPSTCGDEIGLNLGFMARCFGARAPVLEIAWQFIDDCTHVIDRNDDLPRACIWYGSKKGCKAWVSFEHSSIEGGIRTALYEWWLNDIDFLLEYQRHITWVCELEDCMEQDWIDYCIDSHDAIHYCVDFDAVTEYSKLGKRNERTRAEIEFAAIELGL
jgi:hypothetical protein